MWLFLGDAAATLVSALLIVFLVRYKEKRHVTIEPSSLQLTKLGRQLRELSPTLKEHPSIVPTVLIYLLNMALYAQIFFALPLLLSSKFGGFGPRAYGLVMTVNALGVVLLTPVVTSVTKRFSSGACLAFGGILFAIGLGGYGVVKTMVGVTALAIIWTLGELLTVANARVYVADLAPKAQRGRLGALLEVAHELGFGIGPAVAGYFIAHRGVAELWPFLACVGVFTAVAMGLVEWQRVISTTMVSSKSKVAS
jgi:MFS family permease